MKQAILLSIKPKFADAIFAGKKKFEFRKVLFKNKSINKVFVYSSAPVSRIIGVFFISEIIKECPNVLWEKTKKGAGITEAYFNEYFFGKKIGYAIKIEKTNLFDESGCIEFFFGIKHPPQSFRYVPADTTLSRMTEYEKTK